MERKDFERKELLKQARKVFRDSDYYDNEEFLIGYYRLVKQLTTRNLSIGSVSLTELAIAISKLDDKHSEVLELRYFDNYTLAECAFILDCHPSTVHHRETSAIKLLKTHARKIFTKEEKAFINRKNKFVLAVNEGIPSKNDVLITDLNISPRTCKLLKHARIKTASQLFFMTNEELLKIPRLGITSVNEINAAIMHLIDETV